jgi:TRAP-type C4-dicarboxylate transport system permease small subunit
MNRLEKLAAGINRFCVWISGTALILMMLLGFGNVVSRLAWRPIRGTFEIIGFLGAVTIALALGTTQVHKNHVAVDIVTSHYNPRWRRLTAIISYLITAPFFLVVAWQIWIWGLNVMETGETSETLGIIYYPFIFIVAAGFAFLAGILLLDLVKAVRPADKPETDEKPEKSS